jgi:allophanate hydrolase
LHDGASPFGITLLAPAGHDALVASLGRVFQADTGLPLGAKLGPQPALRALAANAPDGAITIAVVGAHLSGMPLNPELRAYGAQYCETIATSCDYRLFALAGGEPRKPGLLRVGKDGAAIEVELWAMPGEAFGRFVAAVPAPLSIGSLTLGDGRSVKGFLVEAEAVRDAQDITAFGGWRSFIQAAKSG